MTALLLFLGNPSAAPPGSAAAVAAPSFNEVPYPEGMEHPAIRYYSPTAMRPWRSIRHGRP